MKKFREIMFVIVAVAGLSLAVSAQKDDKKDKPPKNPPTVDPGKKPPRETPPPSDDKKPKKPGTEFGLLVYSKGSDEA